VSSFRSSQTPPPWCELRGFEIHDLQPDQFVPQSRRAPRERLVVSFGTVQLRLPDGSVILKENQFFDVPADQWELRGCSRRAQLVRLSGNWGCEIGGCGIFRAANQEKPTDTGDPVTYRKATSIDSHYHDCDEYWIVLEGGGTVIIDERRIEVSVGDCVAIGMGHQHDLPIVTQPLKAVFFETTLQGDKRVGHLWAHTHGRGRPLPERV
jgi:mannose-6-phosphate isomerase-like protein (cupin superfamily)